MFDYLKGLFAPAGRATLLGLGFLQAWMYIVSQRLVFTSASFQLAFHLGMACAVLAIAAVRVTSRQTIDTSDTIECPPSTIDILATAGMTLLPLGGIAAPVFTSAGTLEALASQMPALPYAVGAFAGASLGWYFARWFSVFCLLPTRDSMCYLLAAFSLGAVGCLVFCAVGSWSPAIVLAAALALPTLSSITLNQTRATVLRDPDPDSEYISDSVPTGPGPTPDMPRPTRAIKRTMASLIVQIAVYVLIFGNGVLFSVLQGDIVSLSDALAASVLNYALRALLPAMLMLWLSAQSAGEAASLRASLNAVLLALAFVLLALWFIGNLETIVAYAVVSAARNLVLVLLYAGLVKLAHVSQADPYVVFGLGRGAYELSLSLGIAAYGALAPSGASALPSGHDLVYATALCVFIFLIGCFFATAQGLDEADVVAADPSRPHANTLAEKAPASDPRMWLRERYALSEREYQIVCLFCQGHSKRGIAQNIGLSENTVRWYLQQAYDRMDVHSRDELLALVNKGPEG